MKKKTPKYECPSCGKPMQLSGRNLGDGPDWFTCPMGHTRPETSLKVYEEAKRNMSELFKGI